MIARAQGGATALLNEATICDRCHSLAHEGLLRVTGTPPNALEWLDASGKRIAELKQAEGRLRLAYTTARPLATSGPEESEEEDTTIHSMDEVPNEVDAAWWRKYGHNFYWSGNHLMLKST